MFCSVLLLLAVQPPARAVPHFSLRVDSARRQVVFTLGPYDLPAEPDMDMMGMPMSEDHSPHFAWPLDTWLHAYRIEVTDSTGRDLSTRLLHHFALVDFDRRELAYPIAQRVFGGGAETGSASLPLTVAIPLGRGDSLGFYFMWHNFTGRDLSGVTLRVRLDWTAPNQQPPPTLAFPFWVDVDFHAGGANEFEAPPGGCVRTYAFELPVSGHVLVASGHLHAWGRQMRLEDVETGRVVLRVRAVRDSDGTVRRMSRELYGLWGQGPHLDAGRRYLLIAVYDNPSDTTATGLMGLLGGLFVPDDVGRWPRVNRSDSTYLADLAGFEHTDRTRPTPVWVSTRDR